MKTYREAGVDLDRAERFTEFIKQQGPRIGQIGAFASCTEIDTAKYRQPVILTTTDGVGTKLLVAKQLEQYDTLGIDLVAMCVNDLVVCGAKPLVFLDYIACGRIEESLLEQLFAGMVKGCEIADCTLSGGETAELPGMYGPQEFDIAGFAVGIAEKSRVLPRKQLIRAKDVVLGLPSSGIHSNGLSLARKIIPPSDTPLWHELLRPTRIYAREMAILANEESVLAAAHITGGGIWANTQRVLPEDLKLRLDFNWHIPSIFDSIQRIAGISSEEMYRVFNMGIGVALVVERESAQSLVDLAQAKCIEIQKIGSVQVAQTKGAAM